MDESIIEEEGFYSTELYNKAGIWSPLTDVHIDENPNEKKQFGARFLRLSSNCHDNNHLHTGPIIERFHRSEEGLSHFPLSNYKNHSSFMKQLRCRVESGTTADSDKAN